MKRLCCKALIIVLLLEVLGFVLARKCLQGHSVVGTLGTGILSRAFIQALGIDNVNGEEQEPPACNGISTSTWLRADGNLTGVPNLLFTPTAVHCCQLCRETEGCHIWNRHRESGICIMSYVTNNSSRGREHFSYDAGFFNIRALALSPVIGASRPPRCQGTPSIRYPRGRIAARDRNCGSSASCCNLCRYSSNCQSWYWSSQSKHCILNRNLPAAVPSSNQYSGGTI